MEQVAFAHAGTSTCAGATQVNGLVTHYPARVRIATAFEEEAIMDQCRELHAENGIFRLSEDKVRDTLRRAFNREGGILGVIGKPGQLEAMIYMQMTTMWYTEDPCLEELYTYVRPQFRRSRNAVDLLHFSKWAAETSNLPLFIGVISNQQTQRKVQLYQRQFASQENQDRVAKARSEIRALCNPRNGDAKKLEQCFIDLECGSSTGSFFLYNYPGAAAH